MAEQPPSDRVTPIPRALRLMAFLAAMAVVLWGTLAPEHDLPKLNVWDKAEHALAFFGLTFLGVWAMPHLRLRIAAAMVALGAAIEVAQATMPLGRDGDIKDLLADSMGVALGLAVALEAREILHRLWPLIQRRLTREP